MHFSAFRVLVFISSTDVRRIFSRSTQPRWNIILQLKSNRKTFFYKKMNRKISNVKIQEGQSPRSPLPTPMSSTKYENPFLWHVSGSHDISTSFCKACNAILCTIGTQTNQPKNQHSRDMFWKTLRYKLFVLPFL